MCSDRQIVTGCTVCAHIYITISSLEANGGCVCDWLVIIFRKVLSKSHCYTRRTTCAPYKESGFHSSDILPLLAQRLVIAEIYSKLLYYAQSCRCEF